MLFRNSQGDLLLAVGKAIALYPVSYAEIVAAWIGLFMAIKVLYCIDVDLEGVSSSAISIISALSNQVIQLNPLLLDIKLWIQQCNHFVAKHIYWEANKLQILLANVL